MSTRPRGGYEETGDNAFVLADSVQNGFLCSGHLCQDIARKCNYFYNHWTKCHTIVGSQKDSTAIYRPGILDFVPYSTDTASGAGDHYMAVEWAYSPYSLYFPLTNVATTGVARTEIYIIFTSGAFKNCAFAIDNTTTNYGVWTQGITSPTGTGSSLPQNDYTSTDWTSDTADNLLRIRADSVAFVSAATKMRDVVINIPVSASCTKMQVTIVASRWLYVEPGDLTPPMLQITCSADANGMSFNTYKLVPNTGFKTLFTGLTLTSTNATLRKSEFDVKNCTIEDQSLDPELQNQADYIELISPLNSATTDYVDNMLLGAVVLLYNHDNTNMWQASQLNSTLANEYDSPDSRHRIYLGPSTEYTTADIPAGVKFKIVSNVHRNSLDESIVLDSGSGETYSAAGVRPLAVTAGAVNAITISIPFDIAIHSVQFREI